MSKGYFSIRNIDRELIILARIQALKDKITLGEAINQALKLWLESKEKY